MHTSAQKDTTSKPLFLRNATLYVVLAGIAGTLLPFLLLSFYVQPNAEDISHSFLPRYADAYYFITDFFKNKEARLFTNILYAFNPLTYNAFWAYKLLPPLLMLLFTAAVYYLFSQINRAALRGRNGIVTAIAITALFSSQMASPVHAWYWMSSSFNYTTSGILLIALSAVSIKILRTGGKPSVLLLLISVFLSFALVLSNEIFIVSVPFAALSLLLLTRHRGWPYALLLFISSCCAGFIYFIPHMVIPEVSRQFLAEGSTAISLAATHALTDTTGNFVRWTILNPPFILLTLLFITTGKPKAELYDIAFWQKAITALALTFIFLCLQLIPYYMFRGFEHVPQRIFNLHFMIFIIVWFGVLASAISNGLFQSNYTSIASWRFLPFMAGLALALALIASPRTLTAWNDLLSGRAAAFDREMTERFHVLQKASGTKSKVEIKALKHIPETIFFPPEIVPERRNAHWNVAYENFFNVSEVVMKHIEE